MKRHQIKITPLTDLHPGSGFGFAALIDSAPAKDTDGWTYIPGSAIKGRLRSLCKRIAFTLSKDEGTDYGSVCQTTENLEVCKSSEPCVICRIFGSVFTEGMLHFTDAVLDTTAREEMEYPKEIDYFGGGGQFELKTSVKLSRTRRISDSGQLFSFQNVAKALVFTGTIEGELSENDEQLLRAAVGLLTHIGGQKARGLGRIKAEFCEEAE